MTLKFQSTRVACNTSSGDQDITISGFGTPVAVLFTLGYGTADGTPADGKLLAIGGATSSSGMFAVYSVAENGVTTTSSRTGVVNNRCIYTQDGGGTITNGATFSTFITDGVRISWQAGGEIPDAGYLLTVTLIGGTNVVGAYASTFDMAATVDTATDVTAPGFEPTDLFVFNATTPYLSMGIVHNASGTVSQYSVSQYDRSAVTTTELHLREENSYGITNCNPGGTGAQGEFGSFDASGFSCTTRTSATTNNGRGTVGYLALRITDYETYAGYLTTPTSTGNQSITSPGFKPQFLMQLLSGAEAFDTNYGDNRAGTFGISVADATSQYSNTITSEDGVTTTNAESLSDDQMVNLKDDDGTTRWTTSFVSFDTTGFTQNFTATHSTGAVWLYWAVEEETSGSSGTSYTGTFSLPVSKEISISSQIEIGESVFLGRQQSVVASSINEISVATSLGIVKGVTVPLSTGTITFVDGYGGDTTTSQDTMIIQIDGPNVNFGAHDVYDVSVSRTFLLRFILDAIPLNATCVSATLYFYKANTTPNNEVTCTVYSVSDANGDWIPGDNFASTADPGEPCWNYKAYNTGTWAGSVGARTSGVDYDTPSIGSFSIPADANVGDEYVISLDTSTVRSWFGQDTNNGILLWGSDNAGYIGTAENGTTGYRPKLVVEYTLGTTTTYSVSVELSSSKDIILSGGLELESTFLLGRSLAVTDLSIVDWLGEVSLGRFLSVLSTPTSEISSSITLSQSESISTSVNAVYYASLALARQLQDSMTAGLTFESAVSLLHQLAIQTSSEVSLVTYNETLSLAKQLALASTATLVANDSVSLARILGINASNIAELFGDISLDKMLSTTIIGGLLLTSAIELGASQSVSSVANLELNEEVGLGTAFGVSEQPVSDLIAQLSLGKSISLSPQVSAILNVDATLGRVLTIEIQAGFEYDASVLLQTIQAITTLSQAVTLLSTVPVRLIIGDSTSWIIRGSDSIAHLFDIGDNDSV